MSAVADGARDLLITTSPAEPHGVVVAVKDSGPGLAPDSLERIFNPFYSTALAESPSARTGNHSELHRAWIAQRGSGAGEHPESGSGRDRDGLPGRPPIPEVTLQRHDFRAV